MSERQAPAKSPAERSADALTAIADFAGRIVAALERLSPPPRAPLDLDGKYGDPTVRFDPRDWKGESMKGRAFSRTSPEFLDALAPVLDYFASTEADPKLARMKRADAERARGWAERLRDGWTPRSSAASAPAARPPAAAPPPRAAPPPAPRPAAPPVAPPPTSYPADWDETDPPAEPLEELDELP